MCRDENNNSRLSPKHEASMNILAVNFENMNFRRFGVSEGSSRVHKILLPLLMVNEQFDPSHRVWTQRALNSLHWVKNIYYALLKAIE